VTRTPAQCLLNAPRPASLTGAATMRPPLAPPVPPLAAAAPPRGQAGTRRVFSTLHRRLTRRVWKHIAWRVPVCAVYLIADYSFLMFRFKGPALAASSFVAIACLGVSVTAAFASFNATLPTPFYRELRILLSYVDHLDDDGMLALTLYQNSTMRTVTRVSRIFYVMLMLSTGFYGLFAFVGPRTVDWFTADFAVWMYRITAYGVEALGILLVLAMLPLRTPPDSRGPCYVTKRPRTERLPDGETGSVIVFDRAP
jgi:hypothetical protein